jgi:hypothetical protein
MTCNYVKYTKQSEKLLYVQAPVDSKVEKGTKVELKSCLEKFFGDATIEEVKCDQCSTISLFT